MPEFPTHITTQKDHEHPEHSWTKHPDAHIVMAYHKDADSDFHQTDTGFDHMLVKHHPPGMTERNIIGHARFYPHPEGGHYSAKTAVHPDWRKKGVARSMYNASKSHTGEKPKPSPVSQTDDAKGFWHKYQNESLMSFAQFISEKKQR